MMVQCALMKSDTVLLEHFVYGKPGGTQQMFIRGGSARRSNPIPFYMSFFTKKVPLSYKTTCRRFLPFTKSSWHTRSWETRKHRQHIQAPCQHIPLQLQRHSRLTCPYINHGNTSYPFNNTGGTRQIKHHITRDSTNLTYMIQCKRCKKQYIGETKRRLRERFKEHREATTIHCTQTPQ